MTHLNRPYQQDQLRLTPVVMCRLDLLRIIAESRRKKRAK